MLIANIKIHYGLNGVAIEFSAFTRSGFENMNSSTVSPSGPFLPIFRVKKPSNSNCFKENLLN